MRHSWLFTMWKPIIAGIKNVFAVSECWLFHSFQWIILPDDYDYKYECPKCKTPWHCKVYFYY